MLTDSFLDFIRQEILFNKADKLLLAISGGVDSVVLADLLFQNKFNFALAHMNFQLRGVDSHRDQAFVEQLALKYEVECYVKIVEIASSEGEKEGSTQMQARKLRYNWFSELQEKFGYNKLLTAHHAEDSLETVLLNLSRGTGIKGVRGIKPVHGQIVRPLLFASKSNIIKYAQKNGLEWREDVSNQSDAYKRNSIRHHVIPKLVEQNPNLFEGFNLTAARLRAAEEAFEEKMEFLRANLITKKGNQLIISKEILTMRSGQIFLSELLKPYGFSLQQLNAFSFVNSGSVLETDHYTLLVDREDLIITDKTFENDLNILLDFSLKSGEVKEEVSGQQFSLKWGICKKSEMEFSTDKNIAFFDFDKISAPVVLRTWEQGDKIQALGMKGKKKVSDILIDEKIPMTEKSRKLVLTSHGQTVWLVNHRISEQFKISEQTGTIIRLEYNEY